MSKNTNDFSVAKVGDTCWSNTIGEVVIEKIEPSDDYPVKVRGKETGIYDTYTFKGECRRNSPQCLFWAKPEFIAPERPGTKKENGVKNGNQVFLTDYSYAMRFYPDGSMNTRTHLKPDNETIPYEIIKTNLKLPGETWDGKPVDNDTIIKRLEDGAILFTRERYLKPVKRLVAKVVKVRPYRNKCIKGGFDLFVEPSMKEDPSFYGPEQDITIEVWEE